METGGENSAAKSSALPSSPPCPIFARPISRAASNWLACLPALWNSTDTLSSAEASKERERKLEKGRENRARGGKSSKNTHTYRI